MLCNSGNANTCAPNGEAIARKMCMLLAEASGLSADDVIIASTGVIGQPLPIEPIATGMKPLVDALSYEGGEDCAAAIMTTDLVAKHCAVTVDIGGKTVTVGGIAKGYAGDAVRTVLAELNVTSAVIDLGGDVGLLGAKPDGSDWNIAIQDPNDTGSYLGYLTVGETAVITSGSYQRYFTEGGQKYHHILSPTTGRPVNNGLLAVTIVCEDGTLADCLSTAMFVLGPQAALNYWRTYGGFEMLLVKADGHVVITNGLYGQFTPNGDSYVVDYAS